MNTEPACVTTQEKIRVVFGTHDSKRSVEASVYFHQCGAEHA